MRKLLLSLVVLLGFVTVSVSQTKDNVARECVLFELFTGVRCPYCPAAANGVAQLLEEGKAIAPVAYHTSAFSTDLYYTTETNARASYYGIQSYPTLKADGMLGMGGGGSASETMYSYYLNYYNQRINVASPFTINLTVEPQSDGTCIAHCVVTQVGECNSTNVKVMMALTQCNINVSWQGMQGLHHVCRDMLPNQLGTAFVGPTMTIDEPFELNWPKEDCFLTAWVQSYNGNKEVYQAVRLSLAMDLDYDIALKGVEQYSVTNCSGMIEPLITVKNLGHEEVNSFDVVGIVDGNEVHRESWSGALPTGETIEYQMNQFSMGDGSQLTIKVVGPNGQEDGFMADNTMLLEFDNAVTIDGFVNMQFKTDNNPEQTTIQIENMDSGEIVQEFRFELPRHVYKEDFTLMDAGCYRINILDSEGDGLGSGSVFIFKDSFGNKFFTGNSSTQFKSKLSYELYCDGSVAVNEHVASDCVIAPNPSCGNFELTLGDGVWQVAVYDLSGRVIYRNDQFTNGPISLDGFMSGIYFLKAANGSKELVEKLMLY